MDERKPPQTHGDKQSPPPAQGQANDEESEEATPRSEEATASDEETESQTQNPFDVIKIKTSSRLKKLRGSLSSWRKGASTDFAGEIRKHSRVIISPSTKTVQYIIPDERSQHETQFSEETERSLNSDLNCDLDVSQEPQPLNKTTTLVKESYIGIQSNQSTPKPKDSTICNPSQSVPQKDYPSVPQKDYPKRNEQMSQSQPSTASTPSIPPPIPPRRPKDHGIEHEEQLQNNKRQADFIAPNFLQLGLVQPNPIITSQPYIVPQESISRDANLPLPNGSAASNRSIDLDRDPDVNQERIDPRKPGEKSYVPSDTWPASYDTDGHRDGGVEETSRENPAASPFLNKHTQRIKENSSLNVEDDVYPKMQPTFYSSSKARKPPSPPVLTVHKIYRQERSDGYKGHVSIDTAARNQSNLSGIPQDRIPIKPAETKGSQHRTPAKCTSPIAVINTQQTHLTLNNLGKPPENSKAFAQVENLQQCGPVPGANVKLNPHLQTYDDKDVDMPMDQNQALAHHTAPQRPAPKPPSLRSTLIQYPGPLKGYTAPSAPPWGEAHPPPLPLPPVHRPSASTDPEYPPRYMYYDVSEPRPYMPTTEPLPRKTGGAPFLSTIRMWGNSFTRKLWSSNEQPRSSTVSGLGSLGRKTSRSIRLFSFSGRSSRSQFSSLSTPASSQLDTPDSPVDPKRPLGGVWIFQPSGAQSNESVKEKERKRGGDNIPHTLFGDDLYKTCVLQTACCCCWPIGLAARVLASTVNRDRSQPSNALIHTISAYQTWYALLLGVSLYFFLLVFILSLVTVSLG